jgi:hypothetical protein
MGSKAKILLGIVLACFSTLVARTAFQISYQLGFYPEKWLADLTMGLLSNNLAFWLILSVIAFAIWIGLEFAARRWLRSSPATSGKSKSLPASAPTRNKEHFSGSTQSLTPAFRYVWEALAPQEMSSIGSELRQIQHPADRPLFIGCSNDNCRDFAESLASVFNDLNWPNVTIEDRAAPDFKGVTIEYFVSELNPSINYASTDPKIAVAIADAIERATEGRVKTRVRTSSLIPTRIIIGPKP